MSLQKLLFAGILLSCSILAITGCSNSSNSGKNTANPASSALSITGTIEAGTNTVKSCSVVGYDATGVKTITKFTVTLPTPNEDTATTYTANAQDNLATIAEITCTLQPSNSVIGKDTAGTADTTTATTPLIIKTIGSDPTLNVNYFTTLLTDTLVKNGKVPPAIADYMQIAAKAYVVKVLGVTEDQVSDFDLNTATIANANSIGNSVINFVNTVYADHPDEIANISADKMDKMQPEDLDKIIAKLPPEIKTGIATDKDKAENPPLSSLATISWTADTYITEASGTILPLDVTDPKAATYTMQAAPTDETTITIDDADIIEETELVAPQGYIVTTDGSSATHKIAGEVTKTSITLNADDLTPDATKTVVTLTICAVADITDPNVVDCSKATADEKATITITPAEFTATTSTVSAIHFTPDTTLGGNNLPAPAGGTIDKPVEVTIENPTAPVPLAIHDGDITAALGDHVVITSDKAGTTAIIATDFASATIPPDNFNLPDVANGVTTLTVCVVPEATTDCEGTPAISRTIKVTVAVDATGITFDLAKIKFGMDALSATVLEVVPLDQQLFQVEAVTANPLKGIAKYAITSNKAGAIAKMITLGTTADISSLFQGEKVDTTFTVCAIANSVEDVASKCTAGTTVAGDVIGLTTFHAKAVIPAVATGVTLDATKIEFNKVKVLTTGSVVSDEATLNIKPAIANVQPAANSLVTYGVYAGTGDVIIVNPKIATNTLTSITNVYRDYKLCAVADSVSATEMKTDCQASPVDQTKVLAQKTFKVRKEVTFDVSKFYFGTKAMADADGQTVTELAAAGDEQYFSVEAGGINTTDPTQYKYAIAAASRGLPAIEIPTVPATNIDTSSLFMLDQASTHFQVCVLPHDAADLTACTGDNTLVVDGKKVLGKVMFFAKTKDPVTFDVTKFKFNGLPMVASPTVTKLASSGDDHHFSVEAGGITTTGISGAIYAIVSNSQTGVNQQSQAVLTVPTTDIDLSSFFKGTPENPEDTTFTVCVLSNQAKPLSNKVFYPDCKDGATKTKGNPKIVLGVLTFHAKTNPVTKTTIGFNVAQFQFGTDGTHASAGTRTVVGVSADNQKKFHLAQGAITGTSSTTYAIASPRQADGITLNATGNTDISALFEDGIADTTFTVCVLRDSNVNANVCKDKVTTSQDGVEAVQTFHAKKAYAVNTLTLTAYKGSIDGFVSYPDRSVATMFAARMKFAAFVNGTLLTSLNSQSEVLKDIRNGNAGIAISVANPKAPNAVIKWTITGGTNALVAKGSHLFIVYGSTSANPKNSFTQIDQPVDYTETVKMTDITKGGLVVGICSALDAVDIMPYSASHNMIQGAEVPKNTDLNNPCTQTAEAKTAKHFVGTVVKFKLFVEQAKP